MTDRAFAPARLNRLKEMVLNTRAVRTGEICRRLQVSPATVRRDLELLESQGEIRRVHGGAVSLGTPLEEPLFDDKASLATREKHRIAAAALRRIQPDDTVYLDGGSTVLELARLLRDRTRLTVVTNSLRAAQELSGKGPRLILIGGELRRLSQTLVGPVTRLTLSEICVDKAFLGTWGLSLREGLTTTDPAEAYTKALVIEQAREVIVMADSRKIGQVAFARSGRLEQIRTVITDHGVDRTFARELEKRGIEIVRA